MRAQSVLAIGTIALILLSSAVFSQADILSSGAIAAKSDMALAKNAIVEMESAGFNTTRVKDLFQTTQQLFDAQVAYEKSNGTASYEAVAEKSQEIVRIKNLAFQISDELNALQDVLEDRKKEIDITEPMELYTSAKADLDAERYEGAKEKIAQAYSRITEIEAGTTTSRVLTEASKTVFQRARESWKEILIAAIIIVIAFSFGFDRIWIYYKKIQMERLTLEKKIIEDLLERTQNDYFNKGKLSETGYHIKIKKYGELIRDINRQLPLIREEIEERRGILGKKARKRD